MYRNVMMVSWLLILMSFAISADEWQQYYQQSQQIKAQDQAFLQAELTAHGLTELTSPTSTRRFGFDTGQPLSWYQTAAGQAVADAILSLQTPSGGWSKRTDMTQPRLPGQNFGVEAGYVPTFDNSATTTQLHVLARAYTATGNSAYRAAFERGIRLILTAQYPHGGWPQNFPLTGGYHDHVTLNDEVTEDILNLLWHSLQAEREFAFVSEELRHAIRPQFEKGLQMVMRLQQTDDEGLSLWAAQYHHRQLEPAWARAYEMPALATAESATLLDFLMQLPEPPAELQASIHAAMHWYQRHQILDYHWHPTKRVLMHEAGAGPIWPRFAELGSNRPVFGDRDGSLYYDVHQVSLERRQGYGWYTDKPAATLARYQVWLQQFLD
ncbi:pectate lyase [Alkalimonas collagenimarina]|uniref:Pectate lyase n=1 Tax=Alkalimonas collagenimarina TaxID=400390 RepID=A0ABT9GUR6_9GAMM|nr:pectate lyase [Alkalimonas collagenimarina]MDP4534795.1 pectate lyase [Alkalimonas collagenimarina]